MTSPEGAVSIELPGSFLNLASPPKLGDCPAQNWAWISDMEVGAGSNAVLQIQRDCAGWRVGRGGS
jgi:hypothetical protein